MSSVKAPAPSQAGVADRLGVLANNGRVFILPQYRLLYVSLAKNACTSIKWTMARLAGEDLGSFSNGLAPFVNPEDGIHYRGAWRRALMPGDLDAEARAEISPANGWFIFSVVRDPRGRLFSAWQDKLLLRNPAYTGFRYESWFPQRPKSREQICDDFGRFVEFMAREKPHRLLHADTHFRSQVSLLRFDAVEYSAIYDVRRMGDLQADLQRHLARFGWTDPLAFERFNDTPLPAIAPLFEGAVRANIERLYARDFAKFGDLWSFEQLTRRDDWSSSELRMAGMAADYGARVGELRDIALLAQRRVAQLQRRLEEVRDETPRPESGARKLLRRLRSRMRRLRSHRAHASGGGSTT